eukprot:augustus_masked-scaffold_41-processed-gene-2.1-mRNA-1 protein AED:1.00 eAED:1.00 QI:0/0/0/0/1/1/3/0/314
MSWTDYKEGNPDVKALQQFYKSMSKYEAIENLQLRQQRATEQKKATTLQNHQPNSKFNRHNASRVTDAQKTPRSNDDEKLVPPESAAELKKDIPKVSRAKFQFRGYHLQAYNPIKNLWEQVPGCLDSGATFTIGSLELHGHLCSGVMKIKPMGFFLADTDTVTEADHQEQVLQKLPNKVRLKLKKRGERAEIPVVRRVQARDVAVEPKYLINSVSMKTIAQRNFAPKETRAEFEKQAQEHEEKCRRLVLPRAEPILFSNPDDGDEIEHFEAAVDGDTVVKETTEYEDLEEGETFVGEKSKILVQIESKMQEMRK